MTIAPQPIPERGGLPVKRLKISRQTIKIEIDQFGLSRGGYFLPKKHIRDGRSVFVIHGRNERIRVAMFTFLRAIGLHPLEWSELVKMRGAASPYIGDVLASAFDVAQAVVALHTPDDLAILRPELRAPNGEHHFETRLTGQARPNVLFEAGMAMGRYPKRTLIVECGQTRPYSDIAGRHIVKIFNNGTHSRKEIANRLTQCGCDVSLVGDDWLTAGDFSLDLACDEIGEVSQLKSSALPNPLPPLYLQSTIDALRELLARFRLCKLSCDEIVPVIASGGDAKELAEKCVALSKRFHECYTNNRLFMLPFVKLDFGSDEETVGVIVLHSICAAYLATSGSSFDFDWPRQFSDAQIRMNESYEYCKRVILDALLEVLSSQGRPETA